MGKISTTNVQSRTGEVLVLRSATKSDAKMLNQLAEEVIKTSEFLITTPEEFASFSDAQQEERIQKFEHDANEILLVAQHKNELIGMLDFQNGKRKRIAHKGTLGMSVRSSWRGKGVGQLLLARLIEWAKANPTIEVIALDVIEDNKPAIGLYTKMGFKITGREPFDVKLSNGKFLANLTMSLRLEK